MGTRSLYIRVLPLAFLLAATSACGAGEQEPMDTAEEVYEAHANNLEQAAERLEPANQQQLLEAAEAHRERAEQLEDRPGEIAAVPVIVDSNNSAGVEGTAWKFEERKEGEPKR